MWRKPEIVNEYNSNPSKELLTKVLDELHIVRPMCKCCGGEIYYKNTRLCGCKKDRTIKLIGTSSNTSKNVNGKIYTLQVCQDCLENRFTNIHNISRCFNVMSEITCFAFDIPENDYKLSRKKYGSSLEHKIMKYGEEEGKRLWDEYCKKQSYTNSFEYKQKKYNITKEEFDKYNKNRASTLSNFIKRYGEEEGNRKWKEYCKRQSYTKSWEYMVDNYGEEKAREINSKKIATKERFIDKYGEEKGKRRWDDYCKLKNNGVSKTSQELFDKIDSYLRDHYTTFYASKNNEYIVHGKNGSTFMLDYYIKELKICIEFNGTCFHGDSRVYNDNEHCNPYGKEKTAKELREKDKLRYKTLKDLYDIDTYVIWEKDYTKDFNVENFIKNVLKIEI